MKSAAEHCTGMELKKWVILRWFFSTCKLRKTAHCLILRVEMNTQTSCSFPGKFHRKMIRPSIQSNIEWFNLHWKKLAGYSTAVTGMNCVFTAWTSLDNAHLLSAHYRYEHKNTEAFAVHWTKGSQLGTCSRVSAIMSLSIMQCATRHTVKAKRRILHICINKSI